MGCCALGPCADPTCPMCVELPRRFPPIVRCPTVIDDGKRRMPCRYVKGHRGYCQPLVRTRRRREPLTLSFDGLEDE